MATARPTSRCYRPGERHVGHPAVVNELHDVRDVFLRVLRQHPGARATTMATARRTPPSIVTSRGVWSIRSSASGNTQRCDDWRSDAPTTSRCLPTTTATARPTWRCTGRPRASWTIRPLERRQHDQLVGCRGACPATCRCPATTMATASPISRSIARRPAMWYILQSTHRLHGRAVTPAVGTERRHARRPADYDGDGDVRPRRLSAVDR